MPIQEIEPGLDPFTPVCRELKTQHGYVDNLLMTGRGDIALVETKLFRNPQARREVLAQVLDYAVCLFAMTYAEFERAVLASNFQPGGKTKSLYAALPEADKLAEARFIDAVQHNLQRGRALLLVVGDGIDDRAERLLNGLQAYASFGFTLALVELAVFRMPESGGFLLRPRTLANTVITQRTIVEVSGTGIVSASEKRSAVPETLSADACWAALESKVSGARAALEGLIKEVEPLGVYPDMLGSLNLKWERSNGNKPLNLGYITKGGIVWLDVASWFVSRELARSYVAEVAGLVNGLVHYAPNERTFSVYVNGKPLRLYQMIDRLREWVGPMQRFVDAVAKADAEAE